MSTERIDKFCENLRIKLTNIDNLKNKIKGKAQTAEQDARAHLDELKKRVKQDHDKVVKAQGDMKKWAEQLKAAGHEKIAEWKTKHEMAKLQSRADDAERYAAASVLVALASVDEAEQASLEAWLARKDADSAQGAKAA